MRDVRVTRGDCLGREEFGFYGRRHNSVIFVYPYSTRVSGERWRDVARMNKWKKSIYRDGWGKKRQRCEFLLWSRKFEMMVRRFWSLNGMYDKKRFTLTVKDLVVLGIFYSGEETGYCFVLGMNLISEQTFAFKRRCLLVKLIRLRQRQSSKGQFASVILPCVGAGVMQMVEI